MEEQLFIEKYVEAINNGSAAIFAGAGLSISAGFVNWRTLLKEIARELNLEIDKEHDLISLTQYYVNEKLGRSNIDQKLVTEFSSKGTTTENHRILSSLNIKYYWTTNYDKLIETALESANKKPDIKISLSNLATTVPGGDVLVYKMHGDVSTPNEAVLTKDDYEQYSEKRPIFVNALKGDLINKTFLFIGFSFDDPNLEYILSRVRILVGGNKRDHYCFLKPPQKKDYLINRKFTQKSKKNYDYDLLKFSYKIKDLKRFSINTVLIDDYDKISLILNTIQAKIKNQNIFISGAAEEYGNWSKVDAEIFTTKLTTSLLDRSYRKVVSGFGTGIGSYVINGALEKVKSSKYLSLDEVIVLRPFPQEGSPAVDMKKLWKNYRKEIVSISGVTIFLFGNKKSGSTIVESDGMKEEFKQCIKTGSFPIPVAATGYVAKSIWTQIIADPANFGYNTPSLKKALNRLNSSRLSVDDLIEAVINIVNLKNK